MVFQEGVAQGKSAAMPLNFWLHLAIDQKFQMIYIIFLNSQCTDVQNGRFSSGGDILSQLQW